MDRAAKDETQPWRHVLKDVLHQRACEKSTGNRYFNVYRHIGIMNVHAVLHGKISLVFGKLQYAVRMCFCQLRIVERLRKLKIGSSEPRHPKKRDFHLMIGGKATKTSKYQIGELCLSRFSSWKGQVEGCLIRFISLPSGTRSSSLPEGQEDENLRKNLFVVSYRHEHPAFVLQCCRSS